MLGYNIGFHFVSTEIVHFLSLMLTSQDGLLLHEKQWLVAKNSKPIAVVVIVHGGGEHSGRYAHVAKFLNQNLINVIAFDLRGHGLSQGSRLFVRSIEEYVKDLGVVLSKVHEEQDKVPIFLLGHSLGGTIATLFAMMNPTQIEGIVLSAPLLHPGKGFSPIKVALANLLGYMLPHLPLAKVHPILISSDPNVVEEYKKDPLNCHKGIPAATGAAALGAMLRIQREAATLGKPVLILHGTEDRLADIRGSKILYSKAKSTDKSIKFYEGFYHEILNEPGNEQVLSDILEWLKPRLESAGANSQIKHGLV